MSATTAVERGSVTRSALLLAHRALEVRARHPERQQGLLVLLVGVGDRRLRLQRVLEERELLGVAVHRHPQLLPLRLEGQAPHVQGPSGPPPPSVAAPSPPASPPAPSRPRPSPRTPCRRHPA